MTAEEFLNNWLNGVPCQAPCWLGITPGKTQAGEALAIFRSDPRIFKLSSSFPHDTYPTGSISWEMRIQGNDSATYSNLADALFGNDEVVYAIRTGVPSITLGSLISAFGQPSHIDAYGGSVHDRRTWLLKVIWVNYGMMTFVGGSLPYPVQIDDRTSFFGLTLFEPSSEGYSKAVPSAKLDAVKPWKGYDDFASYIVEWP